MAQLVAHHTGSVGVRGSSPLSSTRKQLVKGLNLPDTEATSRFPSRFDVERAPMASIRVRQRSDGSTYTAVLYVLNGKQSSSSFNDHAEALRFQELHHQR